MYFKTCVTSIVLAALVSACSGGSGNAPATNPGSNPANDNPSDSSGGNASPNSNPAGNINGQLTGEIWESGKPTTRFNLQTQKKTDVTQWDAWPSADGSHYVEFIENVSSVPDTYCFSVPIYTHLIRVKNTLTDEVVNSFTLDRNVIGPILLSPDGGRVVMNVAAISDCGPNDYDHTLAVYNVKTGTRYLDYGKSIGNYAWDQTGRLLVLDYDSSLDQFELKRRQFAALGDFETVMSFTVSNDIIRVQNLKMSADRTKFVAELVTDRDLFISSVRWRQAGVVMYDFTTSAFTTTFLPADDSKPLQVNSPLFSPDGSWIMATNDYESGSYTNVLSDSTPSSVIADVTTVAVPSGSVTYVVPVNTQQQLVPPVQFSESIRPVLEVEYGRVKPVSFNPLRDMSWTPAID